MEMKTSRYQQIPLKGPKLKQHKNADEDANPEGS